MVHPRLTSLDGTRTAYLAEIGPLGAWGDLSWTTRYGDGPCGMFEASWSMPLPPDFDHPLLRRGTRVELMEGSWRVGSTLILNEPARGAGYSDPWRLVASGVAREAVGENSYYAVDGSWNSTGLCSTAVDEAIARGLPWAGRAANVGAAAVTAVPEGGLVTVGTLLGLTGDRDSTRWGVGQNDSVQFLTDPTEPTYHVVPDASSLAPADDNYAALVVVNYIDSTTHTFARATASNAAAEARYGHREFPVDLTDRGELPVTSAQARADGILALTKGRLGWANGLTVSRQELQTTGGVPANLSKVTEEVGNGLMVRIHGLYDDLLAETYIDLIIGEARYVDESDTIALSPLGMVATDFAAVIEQVAGPARRV